MDREALQNITALLETAQEDNQTARAVIDLLDRHELNETSEIGDQLLDAIGARAGVVFSLTQLVVDQNRLEDWWNFILQAIDRLPASNERQSLENAVLDLWISPDEAKGYANLGLAWAALEQPEYSEAAYNRAAALDLESAYIFNDRGVLFYNQGKYPQALSDYNDALAIDPNDPVTLKNKIIVLGDLNRVEEAGEILAIFIDQYPNDVWAIHERGRGKAELGDYEGAIEDYNRSLSLDDKYRWAYLNKGSALINLGQYEEALEPLNQAIFLDPDNVRANHERGRTYSLLNRYEEAIVDYERVIALDSAYKWAYANKAYALRELGRYPESKATFKAVLEMDPGYVWAHKECGVLYEKMDDLEKAVLHYDLAIASDPEYKSAYANKGNVLRSLERYEEALDALNHAIRIDEDYAWAIHERGLTYFKLKQFEAAILDFERVAALDPDYKWAFANLGKSAVELKRNSDAEQAFHRALEIDPNYTWVLKERGELYLSQQKYKEALADLLRTIKAEAVTSGELLDRARSYQKIGVVYEMDNRYDERQDVLRKARADLEEALILDPDSSDSLWYLGVVWHDMYAYDRAEEIYLEAIDKNQEKDSQDVAILRWNIGKSRNQWGLIVKDAAYHKKSVEVLKMTSAKLADPVQNAECLGDQGQAYLALREYDQAFAILSQACELDPNNPQLLYLRGKAAFLPGEFSQAEEAFAAVLNLVNETNDYLPYAWVGRGLIAEMQDQAESAVEAFGQALGGKGTVTADGLVNRADAFEGLLAFDRSAADLEQAIQLEPNRISVLNSLAWLYVEKLPSPENLARAIEYGERAIDAQSEVFWRANILDTLGWAHYKAGNFEKAEAILKEALTGMPEPLEIRFHQEQVERALKNQMRRA